MARIEKLEDELEQAKILQKKAEEGEGSDTGMIKRARTIDTIGEMRKSLLLEEPVEVDLDALADKEAEEKAKALEEAKKAEIEAIPEVVEQENQSFDDYDDSDDEDSDSDAKSQKSKGASSTAASATGAGG